MFKISVAELKSRYALGERNFEGAELQGANLSYLTLVDINLSYANLKEVDLSYCDLRRSYLKRTELVKAKLIRANLDGAFMERADFNKADLSRATLNQAQMYRATLAMAQMNGAYLNQANLKGAYLKGAYLNGAYLNGANLSEAYFSEAYLNGAYFKKAFLQQCNFRGAYFSNNTRFDKNFDPVAVGMEKVVEEKHITVEDLLDTLNSIGQCSIQILGSLITIKYWETSRPNFEWLKSFKIDRFGQITFSGNSSETIEKDRLEWSQKWIESFMQLGSQIIEDFPKLINQQKRRQLTSTINSSTIKSNN
jgi:uncharacterized protein YjbI with pentapeptide repeats